MSFILTRIHVEDYDAWKQMFDADSPGARKEAKRHRILRGTEDPNELFIEVEFSSADEAREARRRLRDSGVLERVDLRAEPVIIEEAEAVAY